MDKINIFSDTAWQLELLLSPHTRAELNGSDGEPNDCKIDMAGLAKNPTMSKFVKNLSGKDIFFIDNGDEITGEGDYLLYEDKGNFGFARLFEKHDEKTIPTDVIAALNNLETDAPNTIITKKKPTVYLVAYYAKALADIAYSFAKTKNASKVDATFASATSMAEKTSKKNGAYSTLLSYIAYRRAKAGSTIESNASFTKAIEILAAVNKNKYYESAGIVLENLKNSMPEINISLRLRQMADIENARPKTATSTRSIYLAALGYWMAKAGNVDEAVVLFNKSIDTAKAWKAAAHASKKLEIRNSIDSTLVKLVDLITFRINNSISDPVVSKTLLDALGTL